MRYFGVMDESNMTQNRRTRRSPVLLAASVEVAGVVTMVKLRNLSEDGALIEGDRLPLEGSTTFFQRNDLRIKSRVAWVHGTLAGLAFNRPLQKEQVLRNIPSPRPQLRPEFRRPGLVCRPLSPEERILLERWMTDSPVRPGD
jgi:hypothetical protein